MRPAGPCPPCSRSRGPPAARRRWPGCRQDRPRHRVGRPVGIPGWRVGSALPHPRIPPLTNRRGACTGSPRPARLPEPGERSRRVRIFRLRWLAPGRHLPDERHPRVQLAHPVDEAKRLGGLGRACLGRQPLSRPSEELGEPAVRLEVAPDHDRVVRLERLGDAIHERPREPERVADLAHGRARPVRDEVADHPRVLGAVAVVDVLDDLLAPLRAEVDVDVRVGRPARIDEPLEQEVVGDRLDPADPERVRHDRAGRAAPTLGRDPLLLREAHQVPADEEELGEAGPLDDPQLVGEPRDDRRGHRVVALPGARPAQLRQVRERRLPSGTGKPGKRYCSKPRSTEHDAASSTAVEIPAVQAAVAASPSDDPSAASSAPDFRYDSPSGRRRSPSVSSDRPCRIAVRTSASSRSSGRA